MSTSRCEAGGSTARLTASCPCRDPPILCCWLGLIARMRTKGVEVSLNFQQKVHHEEAIENLVSSAGLCGLRGMKDFLRLLEPQPTQLDYLKLLCSVRASS